MAQIVTILNFKGGFGKTTVSIELSTAIKKDELIHKILTQPADGKSEQRAIRDR